MSETEPQTIGRASYLDEYEVRDQQIDPDTGDLYPWWIPLPGRKIEFNPYKYDPKYPYKARGDTFKLKSNPGHSFENPFDLRNLRFIDPQEVERALREIIEQAQENQEKLLTIAVGHGGTISMAKNERKELEPRLNPQELLKEVGRSADDFCIASFCMPKMIDSSQNEIDYMADLAIAMSWIYKQLEKEGDKSPSGRANILRRFSGFIVCHGTDTVCQAQTYASFMLGPNCPFDMFFVCAQKTQKDRFSDVGANFRLALETEKFLHEEGFFDKVGIHGICAGGAAGGVYNGPTSRKISDKEIVLIKDHNWGGPIIGAADFGMSTNFRYYEDLATFHEEVQYDDEEPREWTPCILHGHNQLLSLSAEMSDDPEEITGIIRHSSARAILIETFGSYTIDRKIVDAIVREARKTGKLVFATNPFPGGSTQHGYTDAKYLTQQGIVPIMMLRHAAEAKFLYAAAVFGEDQRKIIKFMIGNNFRNEQLHKPIGTGGSGTIFFVPYVKPNEIEELFIMNDSAVRAVLETVRIELRSLLENCYPHLFGSLAPQIPPRVVQSCIDKALDDGADRIITNRLSSSTEKVFGKEGVDAMYLGCVGSLVGHFRDLLFDKINNQSRVYESPTWVNEHPTDMVAQHIRDTAYKIRPHLNVIEDFLKKNGILTPVRFSDIVPPIGQPLETAGKGRMD